MSSFCNPYDKCWASETTNIKDIICLLREEVITSYEETFIIDKNEKKNRTLNQSTLKNKFSIYRRFREQRNMFSYTKGMQSAKSWLWETLQNKQTEFVVFQSPSCVLTLCDPMDCNMLGFCVLHYLLEFAQTHSIELVMPSNHLILCCPLLLLLSIFPRIRVFSNELEFAHKQITRGKNETGKNL